MSEVIKEIINVELGISALVVKGHFGFHLVIKDIDSGEHLPTVMVYNDVERAINNAIKVANGEPID